MITSGAAWAVVAGLFGKLPARGDFIQLGLPGSFVRPWDAWLQQVMAASQERMGDAWLPAFLEAPVWRFVLPGGMCGAGPVLGLLMPSVDRVGRYYPLTLAAVFSPGAGVPRSDDAEAWLEACESAGRAALDEDVAPDEVVRRLPQLGAGDAAEAPRSSEWWTVGGPRVPAMRLALAALPDAVQFETMLGAGLEDGLGTGLQHGLADKSDAGLGTGFAHESEAALGDGLGDGFADKFEAGLGDGLGTEFADESEAGLGTGLGDGLGTGLGDGFADNSEAGFADGLGIGLGDGFEDGSQAGPAAGRGAGAPAQEDA